MCWPQPDQVILLQVEQLTGEHMGSSYRNVYLVLVYTLGGIGGKLSLYLSQAIPSLSRSLLAFFL